MSRLLILVGRSGSGKHCLARLLAENFGYRMVRRVTDRARYDGEAEDAYYFVPHDNFMIYMNRDEFVEWEISEKDKHCYGTFRKDLQADGKLVAVLTPEGTEEVRKLDPDACVVFMDTDLKTAVMRKIADADLTPAELSRISTKCILDEFTYKNLKYHYRCANINGMDVKSVLNDIVHVHKDWIDRQELLNML